jgi:hypothetical protein
MGLRYAKGFYTFDAAVECMSRINWLGFGVDVVPIEHDDCRPDCEPGEVPRSELKAAGLPVWKVESVAIIHASRGLWLEREIYSNSTGEKPARASVIPCTMDDCDKLGWKPEDCTFVGVVCEDDFHATEKECTAAGLPGWLN